MLHMHDLPEMTVAMHHEICLGVLAQCYPYVPPDLQAAIVEGVRSARQMGAAVDEQRLGTDQRLFTGGTG